MLENNQQEPAKSWRVLERDIVNDTIAESGKLEAP